MFDLHISQSSMAWLPRPRAPCMFRHSHAPHVLHAAQQAGNLPISAHLKKGRIIKFQRISMVRRRKEVDAEARKVLAVRFATTATMESARRLLRPKLGIVEATIALHTAFTRPLDHISYDVSHQTGPHKRLHRPQAGIHDSALYDSKVSLTPILPSRPHDLLSRSAILHLSTLGAWPGKKLDIMGGKETSSCHRRRICPRRELEGLNVAGELEQQLHHRLQQPDVHR